MTSEVDVARPGPFGTVPLWASVLLARVQGGKTIEKARHSPGSLVSHDTISAYASRNPAWYALLQEAQQGVVDGTPVAPNLVARARSIAITDRMADIAEGDAENERDQISAARLVLEVAGAVGSQANSAPTANAIQINIVVQAAVPPVPVPRDPHGP